MFLAFFCSALISLEAMVNTAVVGAQICIIVVILHPDLPRSIRKDLQGGTFGSGASFSQERCKQSLLVGGGAHTYK